MSSPSPSASSAAATDEGHHILTHLREFATRAWKALVRAGRRAWDETKATAATVGRAVQRHILSPLDRWVLHPVGRTILDAVHALQRGVQPVLDRIVDAARLTRDKALRFAKLVREGVYDLARYVELDIFRPTFRGLRKEAAKSAALVAALLQRAKPADTDDATPGGLAPTKQAQLALAKAHEESRRLLETQIAEGGGDPDPELVARHLPALRLRIFTQAVALAGLSPETWGAAWVESQVQVLRLGSAAPAAPRPASPGPASRAPAQRPAPPLMRAALI